MNDCYDDDDEKLSFIKFSLEDQYQQEKKKEKGGGREKESAK